MEVPIDKGMQHGQAITLPGMADEAPGLRAGDVIIILQQKEHEIFTRKGDDLYIKQKITLTEVGATRRSMRGNGNNGVRWSDRRCAASSLW